MCTVYHAGYNKRASGSGSQRLQPVPLGGEVRQLRMRDIRQRRDLRRRHGARTLLRLGGATTCGVE